MRRLSRWSCTSGWLADGKEQINTFKLHLIVERTETGDYWGYSPDLPGLHVLAEERAKVITLAPEVARALLQARLDKNLELPPAFGEFDGSQ